MLILNRKLGESIVIARDIVVTVVQINGSRVKLGFECPKNVPVHRQEIHRRIDDEQALEQPVAQEITLPLVPPAESPYFAEFA